MRTKRVLIVNCYFDEFRFPIRQRMKRPQTLAPAYLAGMFSRELCEIKLHEEVFSGPLEDETLLGWPDMLVLTGLNASFDRMLHLTAYVRTKNPDVIVTAGGPVIRMLPRLAENYFDYCCTGDIEQLQDVIEDAFGGEYVSEIFREKGWALPRYDLAYWMKSAGYVESSRGCYYTCNFCSLTAEKAKYIPYDIEYVEAQFRAMGRRKAVLFLDNTFGSPDRDFFMRRVELMKELRAKKQFWGWAALVTSDFFLEDSYLDRMREAGCISLFSGIESFDKQSLMNFRKHQNTCLPQVEMIRKCLDAGISFHYGLIFDISSRPIADLREELEFIVSTPRIPVPSFITLAIPLMGTDFFYQCLEEKRFMPNLKIRDLDGTTVILKPVDPLPEAVRFVKEMQGLYGYKRKVLRHSLDFYRLHRKKLNWMSMGFSLFGAVMISMPKLANAKSDMGHVIRTALKRHKRTYIAGTEPLDSVYTPKFPVDSRYRHYFEPTMLTDGEGNLCEALRPDLLSGVKVAERLAVDLKNAPVQKDRGE